MSIPLYPPRPKRSGTGVPARTVVTDGGPPMPRNPVKSNCDATVNVSAFESLVDAVPAIGADARSVTEPETLAVASGPVVTTLPDESKSVAVNVRVAFTSNSAVEPASVTDATGPFTTVI